MIVASSLILVGCAQLGITNDDKINGIQIGKELKNVLALPDKMIVYANEGQKEIVITSQNLGYEQGSTVHTLQHAEEMATPEYSRGHLKYSEELLNLVKDIN